MRTEAPAQTILGRLPARLWHIYVNIWLGCLAFPIASLNQRRPAAPVMGIAVTGLALFALLYLWFMRRHPFTPSGLRPPPPYKGEDKAGDEPVSSEPIILTVIALTTHLSLILSAGIDVTFLWMFVGISIIAGRTLPLGKAHAVATVLPLLAVGAGALISGGVAQTDWLHILPLAFVVRTMGLNMIGLCLQFDTIRDLQHAREELAWRAVGEERLRLARDLHDLLGHSLSLIVLKSELAGRLIGQEAARAEKEIHELEAVGRQALREVRQAVAGYRQPSLTRELAGVEQMLGAAGIVYSCEAGSLAVPTDIDTALAWAVREGTTNVIRHSKATECRIRITRDNTNIRAEIINDGFQNDKHALMQVGSGLAGLTERIAAQGGQVQAGPYPEQGEQWFRLLVEIPLQGQTV